MKLVRSRSSIAIAIVVAGSLSYAVRAAQSPAVGSNPLPPIAPASMAECDAFSRQWNERFLALNSAEQSCSDQVSRSCNLSNSRFDAACMNREKNPAFDQGADVALFRGCEPLHSAKRNANAVGQVQVAACRQQVRQAGVAPSSPSELEGARSGIRIGLGAPLGLREEKTWAIFIRSQRSSGPVELPVGEPTSTRPFSSFSLALELAEKIANGPASAGSTGPNSDIAAELHNRFFGIPVSEPNAVVPFSALPRASRDRGASSGGFGLGLLGAVEAASGSAGQPRRSGARETTKTDDNGGTSSGSGAPIPIPKPPPLKGTKPPSSPRPAGGGGGESCPSGHSCGQR